VFSAWVGWAGEVEREMERAKEKKRESEGEEKGERRRRKGRAKEKKRESEEGEEEGVSSGGGESRLFLSSPRAREVSKAFDFTFPRFSPLVSASLCI